MKRKNMIMALGLCASILVTGCGGSAGTNTSEVNTGHDSQAVSEDKPADETDVESADATAPLDAAADEDKEPYDDANEASEAMGITLSKDMVWDSQYSTDSKLIMQVSYEVFSVSGANDIISGIFDRMNENARSGAEEYISSNSDAESVIKEMGDDAYGAYYTYEHHMGCERLDEKVISFIAGGYEYAMGAHGYSYNTGYNFDTATGDEIKIGDIVSDNEALADELETLLLEKYDREMFFNEDISEDILSILTDEEYGGPDFIVGDDGVTFIFNAYAIAPYAAGAQQVTVPWDSQLIDSAYAPASSEGYITPVYSDLSFTVTATGQKLDIGWWADEYGELTFNYCYDDDYENSISRTYADAWGADVYLVGIDGKQYLWLNLSMSNDYEVLYVFPLTQGQSFDQEDAFRPDSDLGFGLYGSVPLYGEALKMYTRTDLLGTQSVYDTFTIGDNGVPERTGEWLYGSGEYKLTVIEDVEAPVYENEDAESGSSQTIKKGEELTYLRNDGISVVDFTMSDGRIVRFSLEKADSGDYMPTLYNGTDIEGIFDGIIYAG